MNNNRKERVVLGMSGGVDSSAAGALLQNQGYEVIGITLKLWARDCLSRAEDKCCGPQAVMDARSVANRLGIAFYLIDEAKDFQSHIIEYFASEYRAGRTPNPCILCNEKMKFGTLLKRARLLGANKVATGHYARIEQNETKTRSLLKRAKDLDKDQSYFLFSLKQEQLKSAIMPLGNLTKSQTRDIARSKHLRTADKQESMEICFVPGKDYKTFLTKSKRVTSHRGEIVDLQGNCIGHHEGIAFYTIGQRKGLGISASKPLYVVNLDPENNRVIVGEAEDLAGKLFHIERCNWIAFESPPQPFKALARIRHNHIGVSASIFSQPNHRAKVLLTRPQRAITPGQACVFYRDDLVLGGGWITREHLDSKQFSNG